MWHLIGQSIGTHLSLCFYLLDCWLHIESLWYHYPWCMFGYCIRLRHWYVDYIDWSFCLSSHIDSHCCMITLLIPTCIFLVLFIFFILISWFFLLYTILITSEHAIYSCYIFIMIFIFLISLCVDMDDISVLCLTVCCMTAFLLCDYMLFVCVGCTSIPLPPTL